MFGYIIPDKMNMYIKDFTSFRAYYCGLCKSLGKSGAPHTRFLTNYDTTFLSVLIHSLEEIEPEIKKGVCVLNPLKKKPFAADDEITKKVADLTALFAYYKIKDDVIDGKRGRAFIKPLFYSRYKKAKKRLPQADAVIKREYERLRELEKDNCRSVDIAADPFAVMLKDCVKTITDKTDIYAEDFLYNLGKLVYLFDAIDDIDKDIKRGCYNPFAAAYFEGDKSKFNRDEFLKENREKIEFLLTVGYNKLREDYDKMKITVGEGVLSNTVYLGLPMQIERLLKGEVKCAKTRL